MYYVEKQVGILVDVLFLFGKFQLEQNIQRLLFMGYWIFYQASKASWLKSQNSIKKAVKSFNDFEICKNSTPKVHISTVVLCSNVVSVHDLDKIIGKLVVSTIFLSVWLCQSQTRLSVVLGLGIVQHFDIVGPNHLLHWRYLDLIHDINWSL